METMHSINLITSNPQVRSGQPCIVGTGLRVTDIVMASLFHDRTPDEIASDYAISLAQVHAALAYYYEHKEALDAVMREQIRRARDYKEQHIGSEGSLLSG
jgi:uncharacterized protein (DUF433 family)